MSPPDGQQRPGLRRADMASRATLDLLNYVPYFLTAIGNAVSRGASRVYLREFGVGIIEWRVMAMLAVEPGIMANRICHVVSLDKAAVSRSLRVLEGRGYVAAEASADPRRYSYTLTETGYDLHDRIMRLALQREESLLEGMGEAERAELVRLLRKMHANVPAVNRGLDDPDP